jgi:hypothetical protein
MFMALTNCGKLLQQGVLQQGTSRELAENPLRLSVLYQGTTLQAADKLSKAAVLKGHGFIRANKYNKRPPASAAEGCFFCAGVRIPTFSASCSVVPQTPQINGGL